MYRWSVISAADLIPRLCSGFAASSVVRRSLRSPSVWTEPGLTSVRKRPRPQRCWVRHFSRRPSIDPASPQPIPSWCGLPNARCSIHLARPSCGSRESVHQRGYKVVLTGEGADEALAGYVWYKGQAWGDAITRCAGRRLPRLIGGLLKTSITGIGGPASPERSIGGVRPVQQALYEMISLVKPMLYSGEMKHRLADHDPYSDLDLTTDRIKRWHPLNQSLYAGYKIMLPGMLLISKGDRIAMNASVETRYPYPRRRCDHILRRHCAGVQAAWNDREMDLAASRSADLAAEDRESAQNDVPRQHGGNVPGITPAPLGRPVAEPRIAQSNGLLRPGDGCSPARLADADSADHAGTVRLRRGTDLRGLDPALASHLLRRWSVRASRLAAAGTQACGSADEPDSGVTVAG